MDGEDGKNGINKERWQEREEGRKEEVQKGYEGMKGYERREVERGKRDGELKEAKWHNKKKRLALMEDLLRIKCI